MQMELERMLSRLLLVRRQNPRLRTGQRNRSRKIRVVGMQHVEAARTTLHPLRRRRTLAAFKPHRPHLRAESKREIHRLRRIQLK